MAQENGARAAVAMLTLKYAQSLPDLRVNAACPGLTATDFVAGFPGAQPVEDAADIIVALANIGPDGPTGTVHESTFNHRRLYEACGDIPPIELERAHYRQHAALNEAGHSSP